MDEMDQMGWSSSDHALEQLKLLHQPGLRRSHSAPPAHNFELVSCENDTFPVHDWILYMHSEPLWAASQSLFKEGLERTYKFTDFSTDEISAVVTFMYTRKYDSPASTDTTFSTSFNARIMEFGDMYDMRGIRQFAYQVVEGLLCEAATPHEFKMVIKGMDPEAVDQTLWRRAILEAVNHAEWLADEAPDSLVSSAPEFIHDVLLAMAKHVSVKATAAGTSLPTSGDILAFKLKMKRFIIEGKLQAAVEEAAPRSKHTLLDDDSDDSLLVTETAFVSGVVLNIAIAKQHKIERDAANV